MNRFFLSVIEKLDFNVTVTWNKDDKILQSYCLEAASK